MLNIYIFFLKPTSRPPPKRGRHSPRGEGAEYQSIPFFGNREMVLYIIIYEMQGNPIYILFDQAGGL